MFTFYDLLDDYRFIQTKKEKETKINKTMLDNL